MNIFQSVILILAASATLAQAAPGDLDPTFGGTGKIRTALGGGGDDGNAVARQSDGKLVVAGRSQNGSSGDQLSLVRYNTNGTLDTTFGNNGKAFLTAVNGGANAVAILSDGKILVAGYGVFDGTDSGFLVASFNSDGTLDTPFDGNGFALDDFGGSRDDRANAMLVQDDGKILAAGYSTIDSGGQAGSKQISLIRYNPDGSLDSSFGGGDGKVVLLGFAGTFIDGDATALGIRSGRIFVTGNYTFNGTKSGLLACFNLDGSLDLSWGPYANNFPGDQGGGLFLEENTAAYDLTFVSRNLSENKIIVAGEGLESSSFRMRVWRFHTVDGSTDTTFGTGGTFTLANPNSRGRSVGISFSKGVPDNILVGGNIGDDFAAVRLHFTGTLDTAFDGDGIATADVESGNVDSAAGMLIQPDNGIVLVGTSRSFVAPPLPPAPPSPPVAVDGDFGIVRFNSEGTLDTAFSDDGKKLEDVGNTSATARGVAVQSDGKIVTAGNSTVARFNTDGTLDNSFAEDGTAKLGLFSFTAVAIQPDGKILAASVYPGFEFAVARFNPDGTLDPSFSNNGKSFATMEGDFTSGSIAANALGLQSDGGIVVAGHVGKNPSGREIAVVRFLADGTRDTSFGTNGQARAFGEGSSSANAVAIQSDNKIIVAGFADTGATNDFALARYHPDGSLDTSFGNGGTLTTPILEGTDSAAAVATQGDKIVAAGFAAKGSESDFALARYNLADGSLDPTFDGDGITTTAIGPGKDFATALAIQSNGKILAGGYGDNGADDDFAVVRYSADGSLDSSFGNGGIVIINFAQGSQDQAHALALDAAGRAILAGTAQNLCGLVRLEGGELPSTPTPIPTATPTPIQTTLANISTRLRVETGDNVLIGGFIITGTQAKKIIVRGIGASLPFVDRLANPTLELRDSSGGLLDSNDNWVDSPNKQAIIDSTIPPSNDLEAAIVATVPANNSGYTAIVRGVEDSESPRAGGTGIGVVEAYDLDSSVDSKLANISTRGFVQTGDNVLIAGTIITGEASQNVIVRAIGPSLPVPGKMEDPTLELRDGNGGLVAANDNWRSNQETEIIATTIPPTNDLESAIVATLPANNAAYTAIVRGVNDTTGIAVVEVYALN